MTSMEIRLAVEARRVREREVGEEEVGVEMPRKRLVLERRGKYSSKAASARGGGVSERQKRSVGHADVPAPRVTMVTASTKMMKAVSSSVRASLGDESGRGSGCYGDGSVRSLYDN